MAAWLHKLLLKNLFDLDRKAAKLAPRKIGEIAKIRA